MGFHLAKDGEFPGQILNGAVPLAQLNAEHGGRGRTCPDLSSGGNKTIGTEYFTQSLGTVLQCLDSLNRGAISLLHGGKTAGGERLNGGRSGGTAKFGQRIGCDVEVIVAHFCLAAVRKHVAAGGPPGAGALVGHKLDLNEPLLGEGIKVATDGSWSKAQALAQFGGTDRSVFKDGIQDAVAGAFFGITRYGNVRRRGIGDSHGLIR